MPTFDEIAKDFKKVNYNKVLYDIFKGKKIQQLIVFTIQTRLFKQGTTGDGIKLQTNRGKDRAKPYAKRTEDMKIAGYTMRGGKKIVIGRQPVNRVTLFSEGELYNSMKMLISKVQFEMVANFQNQKYFEESPLGIYSNFTKSFNGKDAFETSIMSLSNKEIDSIILYFESDFQEKGRKQLNKV